MTLSKKATGSWLLLSSFSSSEAEQSAWKRASPEYGNTPHITHESAGRNMTRLCYKRPSEGKRCLVATTRFYTTYRTARRKSFSVKKIYGVFQSLRLWVLNRNPEMTECCVRTHFGYHKAFWKQTSNTRKRLLAASLQVGSHFVIIRLVCPS